MIPGSDVPLFCNELTELAFTQKLENGNGNKRTYCFWIYIFNINSNAGQYRHVAHISNEENNNKIPRNASPYIMLDKNKNSLHIRFALKSEIEKLCSSDLNNLNYPAESGIRSFKSCTVNGGPTYTTGFTIDYIPIQRWVHVGFVINDIGGGSITTYIDGNIYEKLDRNSGLEGNFRLEKLNLNCEGSLIVGGEDSGDPVPFGFSGLLSKFTVFNYDLNKNDMYKEYHNGPINGMLASLGIGAYGLRNPVYKLKAANVEIMREDN